MRAHPLVYEINTWPWLVELGARHGADMDLGSVPDEEWDALAALGADLVWLMGVWERSPAGIAIALRNPSLVASFDAALPGWGPGDVVGSPYCVRDYAVDPRLGGPDGLAAARAELAARGMGLVLDFVPNHVAPDHPWTTAHPERLVQGTAEDLARDPRGFLEVDGRVLANGKDPNYPAWPDVVQLNAFSPELRAGVIEILLDVAGRCDGVRCDMAMLMTTEVFRRTWGERAGPDPGEEYWERVIPAVRSARPDFLFIAEAYWDMEWTLQRQGFDHCYDKRLYDRLVQGDARGVRAHLGADHDYQGRLLRFLENHDEPRVAATLPLDHHRAAAVATLTQDGARLVHDGQTVGRRVHLPVFLSRAPEEAPDPEIRSFYERLLAAIRDPAFRDGTWRALEPGGWPGDDSHESLVAWAWEGPARWLVVVNLGAGTARGHVALPWADLAGATWRLADPTTGEEFVRSGEDLLGGLYVERAPWAWHLLRIDPSEESGT